MKKNHFTKLAIITGLVALQASSINYAEAQTFTVNQNNGAIAISSPDAGFSQQSANTFYFPNSSSATTTFTFADGRGFYVTNMNEASFGGSIFSNYIGIQSTSPSGSLINASLGLGDAATFSVYSSVNHTLLFSGSYYTFNPMGFTPTFTFSYLNGQLVVNAVGNGLETIRINSNGTLTYLDSSVSPQLVGDYFLIAPGPLVADTQASLTNNLASLQGAFNLQTSIINNGLNYDCSLFDVHGLCISTGGRYANTNTPSGDSTGALVIGGYRVNDNVRIGAYLDQGVSSSLPSGINLKQHNPLFGAFAVWQARQDGLGAQVKVAAGYNDSDMTVTRAVVGTSEAGSGSTSLISQAVSLVGSYGVEMQGSWIASPYVGIRYTDVKAGGYTEASSATVTAPLSYASLSQSTTSLLAGIRWSGKLTDRVGLNGSVGVEQDVSNNNSNYTATGVAGLTPIMFNTDINKTRPVASIGTTVSIDKRQQLAFSVFYSEQAFSNSSTTSAYGTYTIGF